ncbi:MAG: 4Fe-4S binding protein [Peptococcaceae bacterium]|nr:4Fe-4S binding protein [Peptococcaceae bacterium]
MEYRELGNTGINVSRLCFGSLTIGPLQANLSLGEGSRIIKHALEQGINFIDTAEYYNNYRIIKEGISDYKNKVVIASKSYAYSSQDMRKSIEKALVGIDRDYIDIFLLHEQESELTIRGHWEAAEALFRAREEGLVRAVGISTHSVAAVKAASEIWRFDIIHPLLNIKGIGIMDGSPDDMKEAIQDAVGAGKGIYSMKALGGGNLISQKERAINYILSINEISSIAVGMQSISEVDYNTAFFQGREIPAEVEEAVARQNRYLHIEDWCQGCGSCVLRCKQGALTLVAGKAVVDHFLCRLCGYCAPECRDMCIKII